jgi:hypothetical protein
VRTQIDRDLTTVSRVNRLLELNKNLGRHRDDCALCAQEVETLDHLLTGCVYTVVRLGSGSFDSLSCTS